MAWAARACGAQGLVVEVHAGAESAADDGESLSMPEFAALMHGLERWRA
jgi:3-deoxy-D-arabino-heptulosonate 7-phosphate (DAHP) synthase